MLIGALDEDRLDARDGVGGNNVLNGGQGRYALLKDRETFSCNERLATSSAEWGTGMKEMLRPCGGCGGLVPEIYGLTHRYLGVSSRRARTMNAVPISPEDEAAIWQLVQVMRDREAR